MQPTVELYDPLTKRWTLLDLELAIPRTTAAVAALDSRTIIVIGGAPSLSSAEVYKIPSRYLTDSEATSPSSSSGSPISSREMMRNTRRRGASNTPTRQHRE